MDRRTLQLIDEPAPGAGSAERGKGFPSCRLWLALALGLGGVGEAALAGNDSGLVLRTDYALSSLQGLASGTLHGVPEDLGLARDIGCLAQSCERPVLALDDQLRLLPEQASFFPRALPAALLQAQHGGQAWAGSQMTLETGVRPVAGKWNAVPGRMPDEVHRPAWESHSSRALGQFPYPDGQGCGNCQLKGSASFSRPVR